MADRNRNGTPQDQKLEDLHHVQQGFNSGYDAATDKERGDQTAAESEELTNALNPIKPRPTPGTTVDQPNADPNAPRRK